MPCFTDRSNVTKVDWKMLTLRLGIWLLAEVSLNFVGLDDFADYTEFLFERDVIVLNQGIHSSF